MNSLSNMIKVAVVGGEGIGPEVTAQSHRVLNWFISKRNVPMLLREAQYGLIPYLAIGKVLPPDTVEAMEEAAGCSPQDGIGLLHRLDGVRRQHLADREIRNEPV